MTTKERMYENIARHGENLKTVFNFPNADPIKLCKKLHRLEKFSNKKMEDYCNGLIETEQEIENEENFIMTHLTSIIGYNNTKKIFINHDARGYVLKFTEEATKEIQSMGINIYTDMGGYGILAPDFGE